MATRLETQMFNAELFELLNTKGMEKQAQDSIDEFTRVQMREGSIASKIIEPLAITAQDCDRQYDTDMPAKIIDKEPGNPPAVTVPYGTLSPSVYILGPRYRVTFDRILSPRFVKDTIELGTWDMDIRQVMSDNAIKDMSTERDSKFFSTVNTAMGGSQGATNSLSGVIQWKALSGGIDRNNLEEAKKIMPSTPYHIEAVTAVVNNLFVKDIEKFTRDEMGGDMSQELIRDGWTAKRFLGMDWIISIKRDIIPDNSMFMFSDPRFIGKHFNLEDTTMFVEKKAFMIEFFAYESSGGAIGHIGGLARADFT